MAVRSRVLLAIPRLGGGGAERVMTTLARHLDPSRFELILAVGCLDDEVFRAETPEHVRVIDLSAPRAHRAALKLIPLIWSLRPDVVLSTLDHLNILMAVTRPAWPRRTALVMRATGVTSVSGLTGALFRRAMPGSDLQIYQSDEMRRTFEAAGVNGGCGVVIYNPVDLDRLRARAAAPDPDPAYDPKLFNLVTVGSLELERKGLDILLDALALLGRDDVALTLVGRGRDEASILARAARLGLAGQVRLAGFQRNPFPYMAKADALVLASRWEGCPNVVLEALACGAPVAATPASSVREILGGMAQCRVADDFTPQALATAIESLVAAGRRRADFDPSRFAVETIARQYGEALETAIGSRRSRIG